QSAAYCGGVNPSVRKVGRSQTVGGQPISGVLVGRSEKVTGDEYIGSQQYDAFCGGRPAPEAAKVGFSVTNRSQVVSGTRTGRSEKVTGDEPGTCKTVTGTPYAGLEEAGNWCNSSRVNEIRRRTPVRQGTVMSGIQPGIGGVMTGAERGACEDITGTPYVGPDQLRSACGSAAAAPAEAPSGGGEPWQQFSVQSPARAAQIARSRGGGVTGTRYETDRRITGPFDLAGGKITGTEEFRFDRRGPQLARGPVVEAPVSVDEDARPVSRVTGEGISAGLKITGDDWDRGEHVTGTEGASARRRNPSRPGPMSAMPSSQAKRNDAVPQPVSRVTGSSGNTQAGSLITVSGGARG
ncbi:MAG: CsoS2 family carboxysome shell protein, partial [Synechococcaceae cyanobacterium]|nr:CsoS2 family carboxysome shell protein [Synechococcaceae cyanobacterium]